jgi:hypothetical protein
LVGLKYGGAANLYKKEINESFSLKKRFYTPLGHTPALGVTGGII